MNAARILNGIENGNGGVQMHNKRNGIEKVFCGGAESRFSLFFGRHGARVQPKCTATFFVNERIRSALGARSTQTMKRAAIIVISVRGMSIKHSSSFRISFVAAARRLIRVAQHLFNAPINHRLEHSRGSSSAALRGPHYVRSFRRITRRIKKQFRTFIGRFGNADRSSSARLVMSDVRCDRCCRDLLGGGQRLKFLSLR